MTPEEIKEYLRRKICDLGMAADMEQAVKILRSRASNSQMDTFAYGQVHALYAFYEKLGSPSPVEKK